MATQVKLVDTDFVSFGGVWLDDIRRPGLPDCKDVVGGSATYATLGARFFHYRHPERITLVVNAGNDFPASVLEALGEWNVRLSILISQNEKSTRGILEHLATGGSKFTRLTPPLLTSPSDIEASGALGSRMFHMFADPSLARLQEAELKARREAAGIADTPTIIWEPHPKSCVPAKLQDHLDLLKGDAIAVFSPNHHELNAFFDKLSEKSIFDRAQIEYRASKFLLPSGGPEAIIVRAAENGCLVMTHELTTWLPSYWTAQEQDKVVDPTGAGNAFLGGLAAGWLEQRKWDLAANYGAVAAGIVIEHVGPPRLGDCGTTQELWEHASPSARLRQYRERADVQAALSTGQDMPVVID